MLRSGCSRLLGGMIISCVFALIALLLTLILLKELLGWFEGKTLSVISLLEVTRWRLLGAKPSDLPTPTCPPKSASTSRYTSTETKNGLR